MNDPEKYRGLGSIEPGVICPGNRTLQGNLLAVSQSLKGGYRKDREVHYKEV